jgi:hypothetical protein
MGHPLQKKAERQEIEMTMNKLLPILILLLFATATASATTLHGTVLDVDTGDAVGGVKVLLTGSSSTTWTGSNGKFDLTVPKDTAGQFAFESEDPCYYTEVIFNPPSSVEGYYPDTDEIWVIFRIPSCTSDTDPSTGVDPEHPGPNGGNGDDGKTPGDMTATSTGGRIGGAIGFAIVATAIVALLVLGGVITIPVGGALAIGGILKFATFGALLKFTALAAGILGYLVVPLLTKLGIPIFSWGTGAIQDIGNDVTNAFGFHFNTTDPKGAADAAADALGTIVDAFTRVFVDAVKEATGLSESMIWLLTGAAVIFGLLVLYSQRQNQPIIHVFSDIKDRVKGKK